MRLTGQPLLVLVGLATLAIPVLVALRWRHRGSGLRARALAVLGVVAAQAMAILLTFVLVNDSFVFYSTWGDLLGRSTGAPTLSTQSLVAPGDGRVEVMQVAGRASGAHLPVLVWLPPQYDEPAYAKTRFPAVMVLPGQPSSPTVMFAHFDFGRTATTAIADHAIRPFVAVFPPLMTAPPRDTECTDVVRGPKAETWLTDVREAAIEHLRLGSTSAQWATMGYSTGAFCAVKLMLAHPNLFNAAAGFGGYYQPIIDHTTGNLFGGSKIRYDENSPLWLYGRTGLAHDHRMLLITGLQDAESYGETEKMLAATRGDPGVSSLTFPVGGHNYRNYRDATPDVLHWLGTGSFGVA